MAQDIKKLLKQDQTVSKVSMPHGHKKRFLERLEAEFPQEKRKNQWPFMRIAAGFVLLLGLGYAGYWFYDDTGLPVKNMDPVVNTQNPENTEEPAKSLGDISPDLKKVEDYYLASINLELSKVNYTDETKELLDGYLERLDHLTKEYKRLTQELNDSGPNELLVNALIDNLKFRLNLLYKLRTHLSELQSAEANEIQKETT